MNEIGVAELLRMEVDEARHSGNPIREEAADHALHSGFVHESFPADSLDEEGVIIVDELEPEEVLPAVETIQDLASLAIGEQFDEGAQPGIPLAPRS